MRKKIIILFVIFFIILISLIFYLLKTNNNNKSNEQSSRVQSPVVCQQINQGLLTKKINDIAMANDRELYAATDMGIFKSINNGATWWSVNNKLRVNGNTPNVEKIIIHDNQTIGDDSIVVYALADDYHIFKSENKGMDWEELPYPTKGIVIDIDVAQSYSCGMHKNCGDIYALTVDLDFNNKVDIGDIKVAKNIYYLNRFDINSWESQPIDINLEKGSIANLVINDWNIYYLLTQYPSNLYRSSDDGETWEKIIDDDLSGGSVNVYSTFTDSLPADGDTDPISILVQYIYSDSSIALYDFTKSYDKLYSVPKEKLKYKTIKVGENYFNVIQYYPYIDEEKMKNKEWYEIIKDVHYYIPLNYQATYHNLKNTLFVALNEGVYSCELK
ncbi:hypothetical protein KKF32_05065 [Patescibacteria group bacterium]|nr:hypothetical protein [Patescibacteria group bacterium]